MKNEKKKLAPLDQKDMKLTFLNEKVVEKLHIEMDFFWLSYGPKLSL
jgi:hypothetical protein